MALEVVDYYRDKKSVEEKCKCYLFYHVVLNLDDGSSIDGIIESIEGDEINILIGEDMMEDKIDMSRSPYRAPNRYRRFRPRRYPINRVANIGLLPYPPIPIVPPIYPYPYYPLF